MRTALDCLPCLTRQALEAATSAGAGEEARTLILREVLTELAAADFAASPPRLSRRILSLVRRHTGDGDPYAGIKRRSNEAALAALPELRRLMEEHGDPFSAAVRFSIAANVLDVGRGVVQLDGHVGGERPAGAAVFDAVASGLGDPLEGDVDEFHRAVIEARRILFLTDNCGEIVVDRLLLEQLPAGRVTVAVRGRPVLNDATRDDALAAGLDGLAPVMDNGSDVPGTVLDDCSPAFRRAFAAADLVVAKGQGNYETLSDAEADVFFLFRVKCPLVADHAGLPAGANALVRRRARRSGQDAAGRG
jgi:uncharacterized protein with ATP-grasp and redox domains